MPKHEGNNIVLERWDEFSRRDEPNAELSGDEENPKLRRRRRSSATSSDEEEQMYYDKPNTCWNRFRTMVRDFANSNHFTRGILVAILINTISMGIEHHQQPEFLTITLDYTNYFFTGLFAFEMLLKLISDGLFGYLSDGFNTFDGCIVILR